MRMRLVTAAVIALFGLSLASCKKHEESAGNDKLSVEANQKFLKDNAAKKGVTTLPSGLQYRVLKTGSGKSPASPDDLVTVTYKGWTIDGNVFDQTPPGETIQFTAGGVIEGWVEALSKMKEGDAWQIVIPSELAYGAEGRAPAIPPNQVLVFDMELVAVTPAQP